MRVLQSVSSPLGGDDGGCCLLGVGDLVVRHDLDRAAQRRVVLLAQAVGRAGVEQLLRGGGVGQRHAQRLGTLQRQVQVLLVQLDAEARIEGALDHAVAVHFQDARRGETAHQRLAHLGRIGTGLGREQQRFGHGLDVQRDDDLVGHLGGLAVAVAAHQRDVLAHQLEQRLDLVEGLLRAADHDRQRRGLGAHFTARHRRVQVRGAQLVDARGEVLGGDRRDRAHVDHDLAVAGFLAGGLERGGHALLAEQHRFHVRRVRHHDDDDVGTLGDFLGAGTDGHACIDQRLRGRVDVMHEQRVAGGAQVARHRCAHDAQADEADVASGCHVMSPKNKKNEIEASGVGCSQAARAGPSKVFSLSPHGERVGVRGGLARCHIKRSLRFLKASPLRQAPALTPAPLPQAGEGSKQALIARRARRASPGRLR
ncbi:hypothetical protein CBM2605_A280091 [Cupriavidus neocaledonicus]|uniref:Uncharacterized protein n=1 Tax=Cupriavidus neocaledonicus TaxID=1040979 RepID=A0ABY1V1C2_9BURK|nr:hypothetical protein CBM2605_A280091 [Cupriavidus neocaledonicus]